MKKEKAILKNKYQLKCSHVKIHIETFTLAHKSYLLFARM